MKLNQLNLFWYFPNLNGLIWSLWLYIFGCITLACYLAYFGGLIEYSVYQQTFVVQGEDLRSLDFSFTFRLLSVLLFLPAIYLSFSASLLLDRHIRRKLKYLNLFTLKDFSDSEHKLLQFNRIQKSLCLLFIFSWFQFLLIFSLSSLILFVWFALFAMFFLGIAIVLLMVIHFFMFWWCYAAIFKYESQTISNVDMYEI